MITYNTSNNFVQRNDGDDGYNDYHGGTGGEISYNNFPVIGRFFKV